MYVKLCLVFKIIKFSELWNQIFFPSFIFTNMYLISEGFKY